MDSKLEKALQTAHRPRIFAAILDKARKNSQFNIIENATYFRETLLKDIHFVNAFRSALKRGVKARILLTPADYNPEKAIEEAFRNTPEIIELKEEWYNLFSVSDKVLQKECYCAYAFGGRKNLTNYLINRFGEINTELPSEEAHNIAISFERDVLGKRRYLFRARGILYKMLGKYETVKFENKGKSIQNLASS